MGETYFTAFDFWIKSEFTRANHIGFYLLFHFCILIAGLTLILLFTVKEILRLGMYLLILSPNLVFGFVFGLKSRAFRIVCSL